MGIGGALIMPSTLSIVANIFRDPRERAKAIAIWSAASGVGVVVGPLLGGWLLEHYSWSSAFWVNIPLAVLMFIAVLRLVPESKAADAPRPDPIGVVLSTAGVIALLWGIIQAPEHGWTSPSTLVSLSLAAALLFGFVKWELSVEEPMLDVRFLRNARFSAANGAITLAMFGMFGSMFLLTQLLQFVQGHSALGSGLRIAPFAIGIAIGAPVGNVFDRKIGTKLTVTAGLVVTAIGLFSFTSIGVDTAYTGMFVSTLIMSVGMGTVFGPATDSVMGSLPPDRAGVGSAVNDTTRELGGAIGVGVIGSIMASVYASRLGDALDAAGVALPGAAREAATGSIAGALTVAQSAGGGLGSALIDAAKLAYVDGMHRGVVIGSIAVLLGAVAAFVFLPARTRSAADATEAALAMSETGGDGPEWEGRALARV
jgi:EmrB/QacA subfamily drug resistance transporter